MFGAVRGVDCATKGDTRSATNVDAHAVSPATIHPQASAPANDSQGVERADYVESAPDATPRSSAERPTSRFTSWLHRKRRPSRTVSEFMAEERP